MAYFKIFALVMSHPLFSILCTNYNNGEHVGRMIESVLAQQYDNWELIIVDDGSTDDSCAQIQPYLSDSRIWLHTLDVNVGAGGAGVVAASMAKGEIMGRLDGDDALVPEAVQTMVHAHQKWPAAALITSYVIPCDENLMPIENNWVHYRPIPADSCILKQSTVGAFATFKSSFFSKTTGFEPLYQRAVDLDLYLKLEEVGEVITLEKSLYLYRRNALGISQGSNGRLAEQFAFLAKVAAFKRRKKSGFDCNLTFLEVSNISLRYFQSRLHDVEDVRALLTEYFHTIRRTPILVVYPMIYRNSISALIRLKRGI